MKVKIEEEKRQMMETFQKEKEALEARIQEKNKEI